MNDKPKELHRTARGFHVVEWRNDLGKTEYQVRNWRGTVLTTRRVYDDAVRQAEALERQAANREETGHGKKG